MRRERRSGERELPAMTMPAAKLLATVILLGVPAWAGCSKEIRSETPAEEEPGQRTELAEATERGEPDDGFRTQLYVERDADVYSRLSGVTTGENGVPVVDVRVEIGDRVRKGQILAVLDDADARLAVAAARPQAERAEKRHERLERLVEKEMVSRADYEDALYQFQWARAELERAELELERTRVRAPFAGVVSRRYVRVGRTVHEGQPLFRVTAMAPLRARLLVSEERASAFEPGDEVAVEGQDGSRGAGRVYLVGPTVDPASGTREVIVELEEPDGFRPGATVVVRPGAGDPGDAR